MCCSGRYNHRVAHNECELLWIQPADVPPFFFGVPTNLLAEYVQHPWNSLSIGRFTDEYACQRKDTARAQLLREQRAAGGVGVLLCYCVRAPRLALAVYCL